MVRTEKDVGGPAGTGTRKDNVVSAYVESWGEVCTIQPGLRQRVAEKSAQLGNRKKELEVEIQSLQTTSFYSFWVNPTSG